MSLGNLFHSRGAIMEKARSPYVFELAFGSTSSRMEDGLNSRVGIFLVISSQRYAGAK